MIPAAFDYSTPSTLNEALALLKQYGDEAKILAGGHSLIPMMKLRFASPQHLIDINNIPGLSYIKEDGGFLKIGALTREVMLEDSDLIHKKYPIFIDATKLIADPQVRNMGTIGGNIAHGDAANDHPAVMLALRAEVVITGESGARTVPIDEFFFGFYSTAVQPGEILTEIKIPIPGKGSGGAYHKLERKVGDYATAGVAVQVTMDKGSCTYIGIGLTNVNATPLRAARSEGVLKGNKITDALIEQAAQFAAEDCNPSADLRGDEEYKRAMVKVLVKRIIHKAIDRAK
ncbi:MAG: xanthine dehydrogenase family protein subunit M [Cyclobacteriaceae bacterium]|jgi:carbon-monoxide dehydrogenase medium subunit|nr:xanthine dehydrogenase family protein subunit M [Cyclobacteriaceae bacterium]MDH5251452.1 xanthine dehydrogenase family protein subunit M [Cyclobacteriaceae bacterium]